MSENSAGYPPIITLTTDFGLRDEYVGIIKGVILNHCRNAIVIDLTHGIEPRHISEAAMIIGASFRFFPKGTVHMIVVDPGVGSDRHILAVRSEGHLFVAPDNGVLTPVLTEDCLPEVFSINKHDLFSKTISNTFHGRDIMAPVAARLACGMDISLVGPRISLNQCCRIQLPKASVSNGDIFGEIIHIDHFGNLRTSITAKDLSQIPQDTKIKILIGNYIIPTVSTAYTGSNGIIALVDSHDHLEIAINGSNAARKLGCGIGEKVTILISKKKRDERPFLDP